MGEKNAKPQNPLFSDNLFHPGRKGISQHPLCKSAGATAEVMTPEEPYL